MNPLENPEDLKEYELKLRTSIGDNAWRQNYFDSNFRSEESKITPRREKQIAAAIQHFLDERISQFDKIYEFIRIHVDSIDSTLKQDFSALGERLLENAGQSQEHLMRCYELSALIGDGKEPPYNPPLFSETQRQELFARFVQTKPNLKEFFRLIKSLRFSEMTLLLNAIQLQDFEKQDILVTLSPKMLKKRGIHLDDKAYLQVYSNFIEENLRKDVNLYSIESLGLTVRYLLDSEQYPLSLEILRLIQFRQKSLPDFEIVLRQMKWVSPHLDLLVQLGLMEDFRQWALDEVKLIAAIPELDVQKFKALIAWIPWSDMTMYYSEKDFPSSIFAQMMKQHQPRFVKNAEDFLAWVKPLPEPSNGRKRKDLVSGFNESLQYYMESSLHDFFEMNPKPELVSALVKDHLTSPLMSEASVEYVAKHGYP